jgi:hypothetical protein
MRFVTASFVLTRGEDHYKVIFEANEFGKIDWIAVEKNDEPFGEPFFNGNAKFYACAKHAAAVIEHVDETAQRKARGRRYVTSE